jgi:hypothetical protein
MLQIGLLQGVAFGLFYALFGLIINLLGICLGPPSVGFITDFVLGDPQKVNLSLAAVYISVSLSIALIFWRAFPAAREVVRRSSTISSAGPPCA